MGYNGNLFLLGGFTPKEMNQYMQECINRLPKDAPQCIKAGVIDPEEGEKEHLWMWVEGESINGIHVRINEPVDEKTPTVGVFIPWMSSGVDIYLAYALMNVLAENHNNSWVRERIDDDTLEEKAADITDDGRDKAFLERLETLAMALNMNEQNIIIPCMAGPWQLDVQEYKKKMESKPIEEQVEMFLFDIVDHTWYKENPELNK